MTATREPIGRVTIAPRVLTTIVRQTALNTDGVQSLATRQPQRTRIPGRRAVAPGIEIIISDAQVHVAVHVLADPGANMLRLAETLQAEIAHAIEHIVGLQVSGVDVYIDDVSYPAHEASLQ